jgi:hypothetical protein
MAENRASGATTRPTGAAPASGATPEGVVGQATEAVRHVAESASELAQDTYQRGARYVRDGLGRYPEAGRSIREGTQAVSRPVEQHPLTTLRPPFSVRVGWRSSRIMSWGGRDLFGFLHRCSPALVVAAILMSTAGNEQAHETEVKAA